VEHLLQAAEHGGGWLEFARIAMMQALYPKDTPGGGAVSKGRQQR